MAPGGLGQIERGLAVEAGGAGTANRQVGARGCQDAYDRGLVANDREHERAQVILGGVIERRASRDEKRDGSERAARDREHHAGLTVSISRVDVGALLQEASERVDIVMPNGSFPVWTHGASAPAILPVSTGLVLDE
ncbi:MAG TPA: hypothetical protein VMC04_14650 [Verrucomicrobiae bacterium]|nr:hypothetical protein [Verrucomicrobiae bacterium]